MPTSRQFSFSIAAQRAKKVMAIVQLHWEKDEGMLRTDT